MGGDVLTTGTEAKLDLLADSARFDVCLSTCAGNAQGGVGRFRDPSEPLTRWIYPSTVPGLGRVGILKVLQTNSCSNHCTYCALAASRDCVRRVTLEPAELAGAFMRLARAGLAHGIFVSSGVGGRVDAAMARVVQTAEILRRRHRFAGYVHLKVLPGCSRAAVMEAARYATRLSVNLEAPTAAALAGIAPDKDFVQDLLLRMKWVGDAVQSGAGACSHTTQFVVGAAQETDLDILRTVDWVYRELAVYRAYYSAYQRVGGAPAAGGSFPDDRAAREPREAREGNPLLREHRLYQVDFLLRGYGFRFGDIVFDRMGNVPREVDPKTAYAMMHPELYPVDVNRAPETDLLKVPGIGPVTARRVIEARRERPFAELADLRKLGSVAGRAGRYLRFAGRADAEQRRAWKQLDLIDELGQGWRTSLDPLDKQKIRPGRDGQPYEYAGQTGRRLHYATGTTGHVVRCR